MKVQLKRYKGNPILKPTKNWWESNLVLNCGTTIFNNKVIILYRAQGLDSISRIGYAESEDGLTISKINNLPLLEGSITNEYERKGIEDPRITKIGDTFYITYIAVSVWPAEHPLPAFAKPFEPPWRCRASLLYTKDFKNFERKGIMIFSDMDQKDVALFPEKIRGKFVAFHRKFPGMWIAYSDDLINWSGDKLVLSPRPNSWEEERVGAGNPPIKTKYGWLCFYHGADHKYNYCLGAMLLDLENPFRITAKLDYPILEPIKSYEKGGPIVPNVVFTCGAVEKDGQYLVYYGAGDSVIGVATVEKEKLLRTLIDVPHKPALISPRFGEASRRDRRSKLGKKAKRKIKKLKSKNLTP